MNMNRTDNNQTMKENICMATEADKDEILALYKSVVGSDHCVWTDDYPSRETIEFDLSRDALFVMKNPDDNSIIAAISIDLDEEVEELEVWDKSLTPVAELSRLAVKEEYQGKKIAATMMERAIEILKERGYKGVHILVQKDNQKALNSYKRFNYKDCGLITFWGHYYFCFEKNI